MSKSSQDSPPLATPTMPFHEISTYRAWCTAHTRRQEWQSYHLSKSRKKQCMAKRAPMRDSKRAHYVLCIRAPPFSEYHTLAKGQFKTGGAGVDHSKTRDDLAQDVQWLNEELNSPLSAALATAGNEEEKTSEPQNESASETHHSGAHHGDGGDVRINLPVPAREVINLTLTDEAEDDEKRTVVIGDAGWPCEVTRIEHMENPLGYAITDLGSVD